MQPSIAMDTTVKKKIVRDTGRTQNGYGRAAHTHGYSRLVELECGHNEFVPNSRYKGVGQMVKCDTCSQEAWRQSVGVQCDRDMNECEPYRNDHEFGTGRTKR